MKMGAHGSKEKLHRIPSTKIPDRERFGSFGKRGECLFFCKFVKF